MSLLQAVGLTALPHLGGLFSAAMAKNQMVDWYEGKLLRPSWSPPASLFAPIKSVLYTASGYASYLILRDGVGDKQNLALGLYATKLALDWAYGPIFFNAHKLGLASATSALLWANVIACIWAFYPINQTAAYLLVPGLIWSTYSTALSCSIWAKNKGKKMD